MPERPNILFILSDDHAAHAMSAYGSRINTTEQLDRIATEGIRFDQADCTNALCAPSRAAILTGAHSHRNSMMTLTTSFDSAQPTFLSLVQAAGYRTALFGKRHLGHGEGHDPVGFDEPIALRAAELDVSRDRPAPPSPGPMNPAAASPPPTPGSPAGRHLSQAPAPPCTATGPAT